MTIYAEVNIDTDMLEASKSTYAPFGAILKELYGKIEINSVADNLFFRIACMTDAERAEYYSPVARLRRRIEYRRKHPVTSGYAAWLESTHV